MVENAIAQTLIARILRISVSNLVQETKLRPVEAVARFKSTTTP